MSLAWSLEKRLVSLNDDGGGGGDLDKLLHLICNVDHIVERGIPSQPSDLHIHGGKQTKTSLGAAASSQQTDPHRVVSKTPVYYATLICL